MKNRNKELDVDVIGGMGLLTEEESLSLSEYFAKKKVEKVNIKDKKVVMSKVNTRRKNVVTEEK
ncbi:MAG TPA: hypothetical protein PKD51_17520 [Saprospiraceae bacterium]|nr:hypothetical protein [Saprospiraceae bacterium]HMU03467.1 hypothetical protein [Saprospiraceae bacterium]